MPSTDRTDFACKFGSESEPGMPDLRAITYLTYLAAERQTSCKCTPTAIERGASVQQRVQRVGGTARWLKQILAEGCWLPWAAARRPDPTVDSRSTDHRPGPQQNPVVTSAGLAAALILPAPQAGRDGNRKPASQHRLAARRAVVSEASFFSQQVEKFLVAAARRSDTCHNMGPEHPSVRVNPPREETLSFCLRHL